MKFDPPLERVTLLRRYKRFMADVVRADGSEMTVHCPNTGSMKHCVLGEPQLALISDSGNPKRKYRHTLEAVQVAHGHWAGVNTSRPNALVEEAIRAGAVTGLNPGSGVEREVKYGDSRFDLALGERSDPHTFVEVKNVTLGPGPNDPDDGVIAFPDSVTERGQKHLLTLMEVVASGKRAVLFFCVQHSGAQAARPADEIDARYGVLLREAVEKGVEVLAWKVALSADGFRLEHPLPIQL
ncbi:MULTISPECIES: DNA/RNA nuclease SfsA [unclassified Alcanivorax]|uniref:DNA/RNA nuclease SfsA n=1 Tax=unclassified Alcanivorax TaxID=2638842 RepID=UPI000789FCCB|nr:MULTISPECIES: DNA/RNA nuclease SfsA [unclassified Alcanivorax]KZX78203.1 sugar fermentation stimulation protein SfsA [Alcanivorax sp. HI0013]KZX81115.1 sugar fermentation stimulation protein SfsA [Alcanivorax sp. HI0011]KZY13114.1 sugar fermentation stimulation protein SfsA [Alcanivorax sp. HI0035]KZX61524.1 sugar fermentation stimulation protein SfsA [Alcanivorax sp. HI0003]KZX67532.1 sugar fermentation stimulation protein SfsA [Alcanivorax sp. HI0007]